MVLTHAFMRVPALVALAFVPGGAFACHAQFNETWAHAGSVEWSGEGNDCVLEARLDGASTTPTLDSATVHYRRANPGLPLRLGFRIDSPVTTWSGLAAATLARGTAAGVPAAGPDTASLFEVALRGVGTGAARVHFAASCTSEASGYCLTSMVLDQSFPLRMTLEFHTGPGAEGSLRFWLGDDTSGTPDAVMDNLDNARWGGVERVTLGLFDVTTLLPSTLAGNPVVFDGITSSEASLFWSDFELGVGQPVVANRPMIGSFLGTVLDDSCPGATSLPVLASGSAGMLRGSPVQIYPYQVGSANLGWIGLDPAGTSANHVALLCEDPLSTTSRCLSLVSPGQFSVPVDGSRRYNVVVGQTGGACGPYRLMIQGTLAR